MASGFGEFVLSSTFQSSDPTTIDYTMPASFDFELDNSILLYIILGVCVLVLLLLVCVLFCFCKRSFCVSTKQQSNYSVHTVLLSKSTSVTGLNESTNNASQNLQMQVMFGETSGTKVDGKHIMSAASTEFVTSDSHMAKAVLLRNQKKQMTSTPTAKNETRFNGGTSGTLIMSPQSTIAGNDWHSNQHEMSSCLNNTNVLQGNHQTIVDKSGSVAQSEHLTSPISPNTCAWATATDGIEIGEHVTPSSALLYGTATSQLLDPYKCAEELSQCVDDDFNEIAENKELLPLDDGAQYYPISTSTELSPISPNGVTSSLPLDAYGHPRAWFVPLDEIYHEPLRHSFIDVSSHPDPESVHYLQEANKASRKQRYPVINLPERNPDTSCGQSDDTDSKNDFITSMNSGSTGSEVFGDKNNENEKDWRDSGIPHSQFNLRRCNSSDFDSKKPSLWEQREDRPVVFLENTVGVPVSPVGDE